MAEVSYCENSTITEAWALLVGVPSKPAPDEVAAVVHAARRRIPKLEPRPSLVLVEEPASGMLPPHWQHQLTWDDGLHLARVGHRYLSVHFLKPGEVRYETYERSLKPHLSEWLQVLSDILAGGPAQHPLDRVCFGYINSFELEPDGFDLSRYFRLSVGVGAETARAGLGALNVTFRVTPGPNCDVKSSLLVEADPLSGKVSVRTKVVGELRGLHFSFLDQADIHAATAEAKRAAKRSFFDLTTDETRELMGVKYADLE
ncbi:hypothetical protein [Sorangium sp. So ce513]|uniref:hypothetical protein n=1 Tax=Sorangium sp. So ce513 TaxID=3133315 RepID=UPI003F61B900